MVEVLKYAFKYINNHRKKYLLFLFLSILNSVLLVVLPFIEGELINVFSNNGSFTDIIQLLVWFSFVSIIIILMSVQVNRLYLNLQVVSCNNAIIDLIRKMYRISYIHLNKKDPAFINQLLNTDCNTVITFTLSLFRGIILNGLSTIWIILIICYYSPILSIGIMILIFLYVLLYFSFKNSFYKYSLLVKDAQANYFSGLYNLTAKLKSIKLNAFQNTAFNNQSNIYSKYLGFLNKQLSLTNLNYSLSSIINLIANLLIFMYGGYLVIHGEISLGLLVIISNYFMNLLSSADYFLNFGTEIQDVKVSYNRLKEFLSIEDRAIGKVVLKNISSIRLKNFHVLFDTHNESMDIVLEKGKLYLLKGKNGSGKTTLINTLLGLYVNDFFGEISINGHDFKDLDMFEYLLNNVSIVEQVPFLLSSSFRENLFIKSNDNEEKKLEFFIGNFGLEGFFSNKLSGIDTIYDNSLETLSGGEKQKIAIIRSLLSSSDVLIFDEPTSALDSRSAQFFYSQLNELKQNKIIIVISHDDLFKGDEIIEL